jgi:hypothetical protein
MKGFWLPLLSLSFLLIGVLCSMGQSIRVESAYYGSRNGAGAVKVSRRILGLFSESVRASVLPGPRIGVEQAHMWC